MYRNEDGLGHAVVVILIVLVLGGVGFAGYRVMQSGKDAKTEAANNSPATASAPDAKEAKWEKGAVAIEGKYADADVVEIADGIWRMYYASQPEGGKHDVYSATSKGGKVWTEEAGTRKTMATFPDVVKLPDGRYRMYYQNAGEIKSAISADGLSFKDEAGTRIDKTNPDNLVFDNVAAPTVLARPDGTYVMVYRGAIATRYAANTPNQSTQLLLWATSADGLTWTKKGIAVDSRNDTLAGQLDGPELVVWNDDSVKLFSTSYTGVYEFGFDDDKFAAEGKLVYAADAKRDQKGFTGQPPGDPTLAQIGTTWYMFYGQTGAASGIHYALLNEE